jgi:hypothetical protein
MAAIIRIDQAANTTPTGTAGKARIDLWQNQTISLVCTQINSSYQWSFLDKPLTSSATITNPTSQTATFVPDVLGSYRIQLITNGGGPTNQSVLVAVVRYNNAGVLQQSGMFVPALGELPGENNYNTTQQPSGNTRSWDYPFELIIAAIIAGGGGGSGITQLTGDVLAGPGSGSQVATVVKLTGTGGVVNGQSTAIKWTDGAGTPPAAGGKLRFPAPAAGLYNEYPLITVRKSDGSGDLDVLRSIETNSTSTTLMVGDPNLQYSTLVGGVAAIATAVTGGGPSGAYVLVRPDGLVGINAAGGLGNPVVELSDNLVADYAVEFALDYNGTTILQFGPQVTSAVIKQVDSAGAGADLKIQAANAGGANNSGGNLRLVAGTATGSGTTGTIRAHNDILLDSSIGSFPAQGFIRTKLYAGATDLWRGINSGGEATVLRQQGASLIFGDSNAVSGWSTQLSGFDVAANARNSLVLYAPYIALADFATATERGRFIPAAGSLTLQSVEANTTTLITQAARASDSVTNDITVQPQPPFASAATNKSGGNFVVATKAATGGVSVGPFLKVTYDQGGGTVPSISMGNYSNGGYGAMWFMQTSPSTSNWSFLGSAADIYFNAPTTNIYFGVATSYKVRLNNTTLIIGSDYATPSYTFDLSATAKIRFNDAATSAAIIFDQRGSDATTRALTITGQQAFTGATGGNRNGGSVTITGGAADGGGTGGLLKLQAGSSTSGTGGQLQLYSGGPTATPGLITIQAGGNSANATIWINQTSIELGGAGANVANIYLEAPTITFRDNSNNPILTLSHTTGTTNPTYSVAANVTGFTLKQADLTTNSGTGATFTIQSQNETGTTSVGGPLHLVSGTGTTSAGAIRAKLGGNTMIEAAEVAAGRRVVSLAFGSDLTTTQMPANTGDRVVFLADAATVPTANPVGGGIWYSSGGSLYWRNPSGQVTQIAP